MKVGEDADSRQRSVQVHGCNIAVDRADRNGSDRLLYGCDALALLGHVPDLTIALEDSGHPVKWGAYPNNLTHTRGAGLKSSERMTVRFRSTYTLDYGIAFVTAAARRLKATFSVLYTLAQSLLVEGDAND